MSFRDFALRSPIQAALDALQFEQPTPIQEKALPLALAGRDMVACAQTGSGKTLAFSIPILTRLLDDKNARALILVPTRELALQIEQVWHTLQKFSPQTPCAVIIGGVSFGAQRHALNKRPPLIIATPGRLLDHLSQRTIELSGVQMLVLDEADRMLDMGFAPQLQKIQRVLPKARQTLLFSATWNDQIDALARSWTQTPERITIGAMSRAAATISQEVLATTQATKNDTLMAQLAIRSGAVLIFARTKSRTDRLAKYLAGRGVDANRIHGGRSQGQRNAALDAFRDGSCRVLVATDIAARGLDVSHIAHVINYDLPMVAEDYVHRIGRTGRAGNTGNALSFLTPEDRAGWRDISRMLVKAGSTVPQLS